MAYYVELVMDEEAFFNDLVQISKESHILAVEHSLNNLDKSVWKSPYVNHINEYSSEIITDSIKAFISIYGSGTKMLGENDNPYLTEYINSELWNPLRNKNSKRVVYRPREVTPRLDWRNDSRTIINKAGTMKKGIVRNFKATEPSLEKLTEIYGTYLEKFNISFSSQCKELMNNIKKYVKTVRVEM